MIQTCRLLPLRPSCMPHVRLSPAAEAPKWIFNLYLNKNTGPVPAMCCD